mmetsp:Transcript_56663/g.143534  ORF Transcript_56663/g.143534 Transcript_56663/m.143534 type:complete len:206 (-) Transcript_56663:473-1090(-)
MCDEAQDDEELDQCEPPVSDRHANLEAVEDPRGPQQTGQLQQAEHADRLHDLHPLHLLGVRHEAHEVVGHHADDIDREPCPQVVARDFPVLMLQRIAVFGLLLVHEEELQYYIHKEDEIDDAIQDQPQVELGLQHRYLKWHHHRNEGQAHYHEVVPVREEDAPLGVDEVGRLLAQHGYAPGRRGDGRGQAGEGPGQAALGSSHPH